MAAPVSARVRTAHRAPDRPAIRVRSGEALTLGAHDTEWPQFVWVVRADGLGGWIPDALCARDAVDPTRAVASDDYDTQELDADAGDTLLLHHALAEWWWAEDRTGRRGWIPARVLAPPAPAGTID